LLVVDCIYHPSLLPALVDTIDYLATIERTVVLVVVELRAEDVVREFLELWLGTGGGDIWEIWHLQDVMEGPYAVWLGWKKTTIT
jgi:protein N-lysine methyltransferase METTL21D